MDSLTRLFDVLSSKQLQYVAINLHPEIVQATSEKATKLKQKFTEFLKNQNELYHLDL